MEELTPGWRPLAVVAEGDRVLIQGQNPWGLSWLRSDEPPITVSHPGYSYQRHQAYVYEFDSSRAVRFAATELSAGVWGFYVPV
jgi:hypothetical protein